MSWSPRPRFFLAGASVLRRLLALGAPPGEAHRRHPADRDAGLRGSGGHRRERVRHRRRRPAGHLRVMVLAFGAITFNAAKRG
jgi:hypothetical protein